MSMTLIPYLLTCFQEEMAEVIQEASKCKRFTPHNSAPGVYKDLEGVTNEERMQLEVADAYALSKMLSDHGVFTGLLIPEMMIPDMAVRYLDKIQRTINLMKVSLNIGALTLTTQEREFYNV